MATMTMVTRKIRMMTMTTTTKIETVRFLNEDDYEDEIFSILSGPRALNQRCQRCQRRSDGNKFSMLESRNAGIFIILQ